MLAASLCSTTMAAHSSLSTTTTAYCSLSSTTTAAHSSLSSNTLTADGSLSSSTTAAYNPLSSNAMAAHSSLQPAQPARVALQAGIQSRQQSDGQSLAKEATTPVDATRSLCSSLSWRPVMCHRSQPRDPIAGLLMAQSTTQAAYGALLSVQQLTPWGCQQDPQACRECTDQGAYELPQQHEQVGRSFPSVSAHKCALMSLPMESSPQHPWQNVIEQSGQR